MVGRGGGGGGVGEGLCARWSRALASVGDGGLVWLVWLVWAGWMAGWLYGWMAGWLVSIEWPVGSRFEIRKESASARTTAPATAERCMGEKRVDLAAGSLQIA